MSDESLKKYALGVIDHYRAVIERHFGKLAPHLALYHQYPYQITVVRIDAGTFIGYKPASKPSVTLKRLEDFDPPIKELDGAIEISGNVYLVEMKWTGKPLGKAELSEHLIRIFLREGVRAIFVTSSGYTDPAIAMCREAPRRSRRPV